MTRRIRGFGTPRGRLAKKRLRVSATVVRDLITPVGKIFLRAWTPPAEHYVWPTSLRVERLTGRGIMAMTWRL